MGEGSGIGWGGWGEEGRVEIGREGFSNTEEELQKENQSGSRRATGENSIPRGLLVERLCGNDGVVCRAGRLCDPLGRIKTRTLVG